MTDGAHHGAASIASGQFAGRAMRSDGSHQPARSEALRWARVAAAAAEDRKGADIVVIDVGEMLAVTEMFVVTHANNARQVRAIVEGVEEGVKAAGGPSPLRVEGADERQWILLDYGAFVVHVFDAERRALLPARASSGLTALSWTGVSGLSTPDSNARQPSKQWPRHLPDVCL